MAGSTQTAVKRFKKFLEDEGYRITDERKQIANTVFSRNERFEAEELLYILRGEEKDVSRATIYRTLELLVKSGELKKVDFGDGYSLYQVTGQNPPHGHLYCQRCGKVEDFRSSELRKLEQQLCEENNFVPDEYVHQIHGLCSNCQENGN